MQVASTDLSVLITGESGTGKETFPQIIHQLSPRKHNNYIAVNCGAIPEGTIDSELFGHEKGSFTGAHDQRKGYFEVADKGTIFLDEVAELPLSTQVRLLRVLETGEFMKVGSSKTQKTDVRIVAATNIDVIKAVHDGKFREDLYYRLNTVPIQIPPLAVYERTFDPGDADDMDELRGIMSGAPYDGPIEFIGGGLQRCGRGPFGDPTTTITAGALRSPTPWCGSVGPTGKPLLVFIDSNVDRNLLKRAGYTYVGKVSVEAKETRNWDQAYNAAIVETLPWDVDILLISGGMKGVTVGSNLYVPQCGHGLQPGELLAVADGRIRQGHHRGQRQARHGRRGAYRYCPRLVNKRRVPTLFYEKMKARYGMAKVSRYVPWSGPQQPQSSAPVNTTPGPVQGHRNEPRALSNGGLPDGSTGRYGDRPVNPRDLTPETDIINKVPGGRKEVG